MVNQFQKTSQEFPLGQLDIAWLKVITISDQISGVFYKIL